MDLVSNRGFIQLPILLIVVVAAVVFGVAGYGVNSYVSKHAHLTTAASQTDVETSAKLAKLEKKFEELQIQMASSSDEMNTSAVAAQDELKQQIADLKSRQTIISLPSQPLPQPITPKVSAGLTNSEIIAKVKPSVVNTDSGTVHGTGSGFVIPGGYILTNAHVMQGVYTADVTLANGVTFRGRIADRDGVHDLALLSIPDDVVKSVVPVTLGNSDVLASGENVFTLGYPFGIQGDVSFKEGTLSRITKLDDGFLYLEISAEIHHGNSGGPLVDQFGNVIGINARSSDENDQTGALKYTIPINRAKQVIPLLEAGREVDANKGQPLPQIVI